MKKVLMLVSVLLLALVVTACVSNETGSTTSEGNGSNDSESSNDSGSDSEEAINLRLNAGLSGEDANTLAFTTPWMETVEDETKVTFDAFFSEELVPMGEEIRALQDGTIDVAAPILPTYNPDLYPLSDVAMLPLKSSDALIAAKAFADLISSDVELQDGKTFTDLEYGQHGMKALPVQPVSQYTIGAVDQELKTAESLQNLQLRTGGRAHEIFVQELGSSSVSMPWSEEFEALSRGALDGTVRSVVDYKPYGFDEMLTNSIEGLSIGHFPLVWLMTEEKWDGLPEDIQKVMEDAAYELAESTVKRDAFDESVEQAKADGIQFTPYDELDQDAKDLIEQASLRTWEIWIESKESEGLPGLETAILWRDLIIKNGGEVFDSMMELE
ncbi:hypothetical protein [Oceanobacillus halophilus]|uniref:TRAP transporter substrate-binding protein n=1 Tax=Oceanobacillus halophilus TaxID=930130 RepID=A0A495A7Y9_9BACI|nr:hypothetical protein [Oceanobacillus halophilus]RKQ35773.1 hypothetical protein D8M06_05805 [Oceanobacillus halophilus]